MHGEAQVNLLLWELRNRQVRIRSMHVNHGFYLSKNGAKAGQLQSKEEYANILPGRLAVPRKQLSSMWIISNASHSREGCSRMRKPCQPFPSANKAAKFGRL